MLASLCVAPGVSRRLRRSLRDPHMGNSLSSGSSQHLSILTVPDPDSEPDYMTRLDCRASSTSHSVAALGGRTNIPLAAGRAQGNETILERRHSAMDRVGSSTWIRQG